MPSFDRYGNPIESAPSVINLNHPANSRRHDEDRNSSYTFRQRNMKLNLTLGWELEANHDAIKIPAGVERISDGSVDGDGAEFVVLPAVTKSPRYVLGLLKDLVHSPRLNTNKSCGFHVHVSASNLSSVARMRQWAIATEHLASMVEDLAFKAVPDSRKGNSYCRRIVPIQNGTTFQSHKYSNSRRYHWLNIVEMFRPGGIRTIEIRLLGNTHRWKYVLAWTLFSMELARRGWDVANKPFEVAGHVDALGQMLINIAKDIKPLEKKLEPIPQWVYNGLSNFGIEPNAWERPLARLSESEADVSGMPRRSYSDDQPIIETRRNDDEDDNSCACGCGEDGTCQSQQHENGDCDSNYCERCHENDNCAGLPDCDYCIDRAHSDGDSCQRRVCGTCFPVPRFNRPAIRAVAPIVNPLDMTGTASSNMTIHPSNGLHHEGYSALVHPDTFDVMQAEINTLRNMIVDNVNMQMNQAMIYGVGVSSIVWDESANVGTGVNVLPTLPEELALPMTDMERLASDNRERAHTPTAGRALTVAEIEALTRQNGGR